MSDEGKKFYEYKAEGVISHPDGSVEIQDRLTASGGCNSFFLDAKYEVLKKVTLKIGSLIRVYSHGRFCRVDGVDIDGVPIFRKTQADHMHEWETNFGHILNNKERAKFGIPPKV